MVGTEKLLKNGSGNELIAKEDLQAILRKKLGKGLIVEGVTTSTFLAPGDNFACAIYAIHALVRRGEAEPEEKLELVGKVFPSAQNVREMFDFSMCFKKEIFCYQKLIPAYRQLQVDFNMDEDEIFEIGPTFYGTRYSRMLDAKDIDDGVLLLLENLKTNGYYTLDKIEGLDLTHARFTIKGLAQFHALGVACKRHRPDFFRGEVLEHASSTLPSKPDELDDMLNFVIGKLSKDPRISPYGRRIADNFTAKPYGLYSGEHEAREPWLTIVHLDFWTNNVLYRRPSSKCTANGGSGATADVEPETMRIIDFQNYSYGSPLRDLVYLLCTSTSREVMSRHLDELLDLYYETFIEYLGRLGCDPAPFGRASFDEQLKIDAASEFFHNVLAIKFFCAEIDSATYDQSQLQEIVIYSDINEVGYDKWYDIVLTYVKQGWL